MRSPDFFRRSKEGIQDFSRLPPDPAFAGATIGELNAVKRLPDADERPKARLKASTISLQVLFVAGNRGSNHA
jgi:hypothetical protein